MKKIVMWLASIMLLCAFVLAQPDKPVDPLAGVDYNFRTGNNAFLDIVPPENPAGDGAAGCTAYDVKDNTCLGDIMHYKKCILTMDGNVWQDQSVDCKADFPENVCMNGQCMKPEQVNDYWGQVIAIVIIVGIVIFAIWHRRKKK